MSSQLKALVGFDGYIDLLFRIKKAENGQQNFTKINDFGEYILAKNDKSFSLELAPIQQKIGGNAPIFANALAYLGIDVSLIASLGLPANNQIFSNLSSICKTYSYAEPGVAYAYEFDNGKIMLYNNGDLNEVNWGSISEKLGLDLLLEKFNEADFFCLLNWSELHGMSSILKGVLSDILPKISVKKRSSFFDLADCSGRKKEDILEILTTINQFSEFTEVSLSLNKNEAETVFKALYHSELKSIEDMGHLIFEKLRIQRLILHNSKTSQLYLKDKMYKSDTIFIEQPVISTGAGDHFNAGFCAAKMLNMNDLEALSFANTCAYFYISTGNSPSFATVAEYINLQTQ